MNKEISEQEALSRLTALCAASEHCQHDMTDRMARWGVAPDAQARIMEHLISHRYVDDERYARAFVNDKLTYNKWGPRKIDQALCQKRIDSQVRQRVLEDIDDDMFVETLRPLLASKRRSTRASSDYELNGKLIRFAMGRGFTMPQIRQCLGDTATDDFD
ncbi:MAG: RecX family transcriptional regulator [Prevotella sp.]|nr:RecX family transcriptional regulator [Prevotella sp.]